VTLKNENYNMLVSIIIPLHNKEQYFERCFNSVINQTYKYIECLIVEDCSTDNSHGLAENLIQNYSGNIRFVLIKHEQNSGASVSRNTGIKNANGEYIFFLDADDVITENCINSLAALAKKYPDVDMVQGNRITRTTGEDDTIKTKKGELPEIVNGNMEIKKKYSRYIPSTPWNKLVRKVFIVNNNLYFREGITHEDTHWKIFYLKKIESFAFTGEITYIFYINPSGVMRNPNLFFSISSRLTIAEDILTNLDIDLFDQQILMARDLLNQQRKRIISDKKYSSLMPKCNFLLRKLPGAGFFIFLPLRLTAKKLKQGTYLILARVLSEKSLITVKTFLKRGH